MPQPPTPYSSGAHELGLASTAVLVELIRRLVDTKLLNREQALALLGEAADVLATSYSKPTYVQAANLIRDEIVPKV
jgi:hypothetical protein